MPDHSVALTLTRELPVGTGDLEVPVRRNGRRYGTLTVSSEGLSWNPSTSRPPVAVGWDALQDAFAAAAAAKGTGADASAAAPTAARSTAAKSTAKAAGTRARAGKATRDAHTASVNAAVDEATAASPGGDVAPEVPPVELVPAAEASTRTAAARRKPTARNAALRTAAESGAGTAPREAATDEAAPAVVPEAGGFEVPTPAETPLATKRAPRRPAGRNAARTTGQPAAAAQDAPPNAREVRRWAEGIGFAVPARGPLSAFVLAEYRAAHRS
ncbi:Lsr2 protein [Kineococcus xinjiangensis]|uniref:Lsr2 protein n=1 Tax=Kineococcus xinjiangensis TaxID=512762 RepID=A0A2S6IDN9_9ACTN|nr:Lsr2 family protein [Kineococcus xinjiangensis]PPK92319.1 Lsr2 protein [Kineococcus xinjiangensis]